MRIFLPFCSYGDPGFKPAARRCAARNAAQRCNASLHVATHRCTLQRRDDGLLHVATTRRRIGNDNARP
jgi:hypothetical protein